MAAPENILSRIGKLLTLASDPGATPGESRAALRKARQMMNDYDVTSGEVQRALDARENPVVDRPACYRGRRLEQPAEELLAACCLLFDCRRYLDRLANGRVTYRVFGREPRIAVVAALWHALRQEMSRKAKHCFPGKSKRARRDRRAFSRGFSASILVRAREATEEMKTGTGAGLARLDELDRYEATLSLTGGRARKSARLTKAVGTGLLAGDRAHLGPDGLHDSGRTSQPLLTGQEALS